MQNWVTEIMEQFGYLGVFLMMTLENLFPPIPSEIVLPFGGFLTSYTNLTVIGVVTAATLGSVIGAMILYCVGMLIDVARLERLVERYGHILRIKKEDVHKADTWFTKYGYWTVFFCRMIPVVRSLISVPAGMSRMNFSVFLLLTIVGTIIWNVILITAGVILGENWSEVVSFIGTYSSVVYGFLLIIGIFVLYYYFRLRKKR